MASSRQVGQVKHNAPKLLVDVLSCTALREFSNRKKNALKLPLLWEKGSIITPLS